jgi:hypothetical protein
LGLRSDGSAFRIRALKHRWSVVALALVAASAFALSVQAGRWWTIGDVEIGPFGSHSAFGGPGSLSWAGGSARWERFGVATGAGGLIAMLVLVVVAGAVAAHRVPRLAAQTALVAVATAALAAIGFVVARPDNGLPFELGRGAILFAAAVVLGITAAVRVLRTPGRDASSKTSTASSG